MTFKMAKQGGVLATLDTNVQDNYSDDDDFEDSKDIKRNRKGRKSVGSRGRKSFLRVDDDEEEEAYLSPLVCSDGSDEENSAKDDKMKKSLTLDDAMGLTKSPAPKTPTTAQKKRRRRRSSARFLRLSGRFGDDNENDADGNGAGKGTGGKAYGGPSLSAVGQDHLGEVYSQAIRMNAENKINAGNSWGLRLIENMDKFIGDDDDEKETNSTPSPRNQPSPDTEKDFQKNDNSSNQKNQKKTLTEKKKKRRVNFTKASCALDASVKIYSCRVDDVHLTSYRVLANLNRTDRGKGENRAGDDVEHDAESPEGKDEGRVRRRNNSDKGRTTETLESNLANINMSKLDSAYDIDPLFHNMSKTFDEGGAKGLLLVNLKNSDSELRIVLDSKEDSVAASTGIMEVGAEVDEQEEEMPDGGEEMEANEGTDCEVHPEGDVDISAHTAKFGSALNGLPVSSVFLVPQVCGLREKFARLEEDGYVKDEEPSKKSNRYANSEEEEKEAEEIIHREHLERTQASMAASMANTSFAFSTTSDTDDFAMNDFGGGDDDDGGVDGFGEFAPMADEIGRLSSVSFSPDDEFARGGSLSTKSSTALKLNALCSSAALGGGGDYDYFNNDFLEKITSGNQWAGSAHWTKKERLRRTRAKVEKKESTSTPNRKKTQKERTFVSLSSARPSCLNNLFEKKSTRRGRSADPLQLSQAAKKKQVTVDNLLPPDAGIGIEQLSCFFLRPNAAVKPVGRDMKDCVKNVGFHEDVFPSLGFDDGDDNSFGHDGGGIGFDLNDGDANFGTMDDDIVESLEGIRKVEKVEVGYATVAKKVDVRKLKKELWAELEAKTTRIDDSGGENEDTTDSPDGENSPKSDSTEKETPVVSFQDTVREMDSSQSQADVTIAYYFICLLHLANEKGLRLDSSGLGLEDFMVYRDDGSNHLLDIQADTEMKTPNIATQREKRKQGVSTYSEMNDDDSVAEDNEGEDVFED